MDQNPGLAALRLLSHSPCYLAFPEQKVVGATGFEPATSWSQTKCSTRLSYAPTVGAKHCTSSPECNAYFQGAISALVRRAVAKLIWPGENYFLECQWPPLGLAKKLSRVSG